jgi:predicted solute-binding protein
MRLGSVPYWNARPLLWGLNAELATPVQLAEWLRDGKVDAALVPIVETMENPRYWLVDGVGIGCDGPVYSVILALGNGPLENVRRVQLDPASKTSARLTRWLLEEHYGVAPEYGGEDAAVDARLMIGDPAIEFRRQHPERPVLDLGEAWKHATGLPFVFAVWALREPDQHLADLLREAARKGLEARDEITADPLLRRYLRESIRYELGVRQKAGIERFAAAVQRGWQARWI